MFPEGERNLVRRPHILWSCRSGHFLSPKCQLGGSSPALVYHLVYSFSAPPLPFGRNSSSWLKEETEMLAEALAVRWLSDKTPAHLAQLLQQVIFLDFAQRESSFQLTVCWVTSSQKLWYLPTKWRFVLSPGKLTRHRRKRIFSHGRRETIPVGQLLYMCRFSDFEGKPVCSRSHANETRLQYVLFKAQEYILSNKLQRLGRAFVSGWNFNRNHEKTLLCGE